MKILLFSPLFFEFLAVVVSPNILVVLLFTLCSHCDGLAVNLLIILIQQNSRLFLKKIFVKTFNKRIEKATKFVD